ncbi:hypothetical protein FRC02_003830 [Tulasnella sp. 418]|nr:hypothetical protein FRC02_003830 [Tulasnella sp. 418]
MVSEADDRFSILEPGTYIIRSIVSHSMPLNLTQKDSDAQPVVCTWNAARSPTQRWCIETGANGVLIRNAETNHYMSYEFDPDMASSSHSGSRDTKPQDPISGTRVIGTGHPTPWELQQGKSFYFIKLASNPKLVLDLYGSMQCNGARLITSDFHGGNNQRWVFKKVDDIRPPSYNRKSYIGPVPPGVYWFGQPYRKATKLPDVDNISLRKLPSVLALGVTSRLTPEDEEHADIHLVPIRNGPWPHQIWAVESGRKGYRIRNLGINAYLSYVDSNLVFDNAVDGSTSVTEWVPKQDSATDISDIFDAYIRPSFDYNLGWGVTLNAKLFNEVCAIAGY